MLDRAAPPKKLQYADRLKNCGTTCIFVNRRELLQTGIKCTKNTEEMTTRGPAPLKERGRTGY